MRFWVAKEEEERCRDFRDVTEIRIQYADLWIFFSLNRSAENWIFLLKCGFISWRFHYFLLCLLLYHIIALGKSVREHFMCILSSNTIRKTSCSLWKSNDGYKFFISLSKFNTRSQIRGLTFEDLEQKSIDKWQATK